MASATDILNAIADDKFSTLQYYKPCRNTSGDIIYVTGSFGIVVQMQDQQANKFALKCFYEITIQKEKHLRAVSEYVLHNPSPYLVNFQYLHNELFVKPRFGTGQYLCIAIMPWIEGNTLGALINKYCSHNDKLKIATLTANFDDMAEWLLQQPIAHGDLKHNNILVTDNNQLILVDYDGMYLPEFAGEIAPELGTPEYQHPLRNNKFYNNSIDDFSILLISLSLHILHQQPTLYQQYNNGENIIFTINDFTNTTQCQLHKTILELAANTIRLRHSLFSMLLANEPGNENGLLLPIISNSKLKVEKLSLYQEYGEFFIENINYGTKLKILSEYYPFRYDEIFVFSGLLDWKILSTNQNIKWSIKLIEKYSDNWDWSFLSCNESLPFSVELFMNFKDKWDWKKMSRNTNLAWSNELIEKFKEKWDWAVISSNKSLPWSVDLIEKYKNRWSWFGLTVNNSLYWSKETIEIYESKFNLNKLNWDNLSRNPNVLLTSELIDKYESKWQFRYLFNNKKFPWTINLIEKYKEKINWNDLSRNQHLPWCSTLLEKYKNKWCWGWLSKNESLPWNLALIESNIDNWNWERMSQNEKLPKSKELIEKFENKWNSNKWSWYNLSSNKGLPWSVELIQKYYHKWNWKRLSSNSNLPWSISFVKKYENKWDWDVLNSNEGLCWSIEFLKIYQEKFNCDFLIEYNNYFKPLLQDELFLKALYKDCLLEKESEENKTSLAMLMQAMLKTDDTE